MTFISDPERFPGHHLNADRSNFWGFTSACLHCMLQDLGFAALRTNVRGDRVFIDATRSDDDETNTRLPIAYGVRPAVPAGPDRDDENAWQIF